MTQPSTAVAKRTEAKVLDLESAKTAQKFLDAYNGRIAQMNSEQQAMFLMALGQVLGVKAELGEVILYQGKPYITLDGRIRLAHATGLLVGLEARPATLLERRNYGAVDDEALWVAHAYRRGAGRAFVGWGHVRKDEKNPVTKSHPREMAKKRAKYDALRAAFPAAEQITPMHQRYIDDAEAQIRSGQTIESPALAALTAGDDAVETEVADEGHTAAAESEAEILAQDQQLVEEETPKSPPGSKQYRTPKPGKIEDALELNDRRPQQNRNAQLD